MEKIKSVGLVPGVSHPADSVNRNTLIMWTVINRII